MASTFGLSVFQALLRCYPSEFRDDYGREMTLVLADRYQRAANGWQRTLISVEAFVGVFTHSSAGSTLR